MGPRPQSRVWLLSVTLSDARLSVSFDESEFVFTVTRESEADSDLECLEPECVDATEAMSAQFAVGGGGA